MTDFEFVKESYPDATIVYPTERGAITCAVFAGNKMLGIYPAGIDSAIIWREVRETMEKWMLEAFQR